MATVLLERIRFHSSKNWSGEEKESFIKRLSAEPIDVVLPGGAIVTVGGKAYEDCNGYIVVTDSVG